MNSKFSIPCILIVLCLIFYNFSFSNLSGNVFYDSEDKLWAHRVLDTNNIDDFSREFRGFELDVYFNVELDCFDVKHHGDRSDLKLSEYFKAIEDFDSIKLWIDFKNLNLENTDVSIRLLSSLCAQYDIKSHVIIESKQIHLLSKFKEAGFYISYWLPSFHYLKSIVNIFKIKNNLIEFKPDVISMPYSSISFYSKKFPNYPIHCWTNGMTDKKDKLRIEDLGKIKNVKVILTDFKENFLK